MGYYIRYGDYTRQEKERIRKQRRRGWFLGLAVLLCVISLRMLFPQMDKWVRAAFMPGMDERAAEVFADFLVEIREGESVSHALEAFCYEIMEEADRVP